MTSSANEPIVLTGCGWVTPFAAGSIADVLTAAASAGPAPSPGRAYWAIPDGRLDDYPGLTNEIKRDKGAWVTAIAFEHAHQQAALSRDEPAPQRRGLVLGCGLAGQLGMIDFANEVREQSARFVSPIHFPQTVGNYIAGALARGYGIRGPNLTLASGSASSLNAILEGCEWIANGQADIVIAGGTEILSDKLATGLAEPGVLLSEGACLFVLESAPRAADRGVAPLATITRPAASPSDRTLPTADAAVLSSAAAPHPGAIFIEHWVGRCLGASGAAAVAAAIGAARQAEVPLINASDPPSVHIGRVAVKHVPEVPGQVPAVIFTEVEGPGRTLLDVLISHDAG